MRFSPQNIKEIGISPDNIGGRLNHFKVRVPVHSSTKSPKGKVILATFWSKTKPPPTENCSESKINWYTVTLGIEPKNRFFFGFFGPSAASF